MYSLLIVDDEEMIRNGISHAINWEEAGIDEVRTAASAKEGLRLIGLSRPDILITDINMPEMNGLDFIQRVKELSDSVHILILTGYDRFEYAKRALQLKVDDFLLKPVDERELLRIVVDIIAGIEKERQDRAAPGENVGYNGMFRQFLLETYMDNLFRGGRPEEKERRNFYEVFGIQEKEGRNYQVCFVVPVNLPDIRSEPLVYFSIQNICIEVLDQAGKGLTVGFRGRRMLLILFVEEKDLPWQSVHDIEEQISAETGYTPDMVPGCKVSRFEELSVSYNDAIQKLNIPDRSSGHETGLEDAQSGDDNEIIRMAKQYIAGNLGGNLTVSGIAAQMYVSPNYFSRLFKRMTGEGCNEYIIRKRMEAARGYLTATSMKIGEIAQATGYKDIYYFSLTFKRYTGSSPSKYRAMMEGKTKDRE